MKNLLTLALCFCSFALCAQDYEVVSSSVNWDDADRGRSVSVDIYFPSNDGSTIADGEFPVIAFGHGFVMAAGSYQNIWEYLVPRGYIMAFATTETGFAPNHNNFGGDIAFIANHIATQAEFADHLNGKTCFMGHSMGGGSSFLAGGSSAASCVVGLAPAETDPSAIAAANSIAAPTLVFSGTADAVTPPEDHHIPIYQGTTAENKFFVSITGGAHCYYANSDFACDFGESTTGGNITVSREEQHQIMFDVMEPFLENCLKSACPNWNDYSTFLESYGAVTTELQFVESNNAGVPTISVDSDAGSLTSNEAASYQWYINGEPAGNEQTLDVSAQEMTFEYSLTVTYEDMCSFDSDTGTYEVEMIVDGVEEWDYNIQLHPNPCNDFLEINLSDFREAALRVSIYDLTGSLLFEQDLHGAKCQLNLEDLRTGVFLLTVSNQNAILSRQKFVKQ